MTNQFLQIGLFLALVGVLLFAATLASAWVLLSGRRGWFAASAGALAAALSLAVLLMAGTRWDAGRLWTQGRESLAAACEAKAAQWEKAGAPADKVEMLRGLCRQYVVLAFPAWLLVICLVLGMTGTGLAARVLSRKVRGIAPPEPFRRWRVPEPVIFGFLLACLLKLFRPEGAPDLHPQNLAANHLLVFFGGVYAIGGLGVVSHYFHQWRFPFFARVLGYLLLFNLAVEAAALFGILDVWFDFRKLKRPPPQEATP